MSIPPFKKRLRTALESPDLEVALDRALPQLAQRRRERFEGVDFRARQAALADRRAEAIDRLPQLVEQFREEAELAGCRVHMAADAAAARRIAGEIALACNAKLIVKGKSNVTEEIGLNEHLASLGIEVAETDLGEWIVQIAGDRPSHTLAPALHKTREQVAQLFSQATGQSVPDDRESLVAVARKELRRKFIEADMGISGANLGIAETGTLVLVTNEGNGRLVSTLPPVYLAIMGIEKIVPSLQDAVDILPMLTASATGQKISTYVSLTTGPSRSADIEGIPTIGAHGPREVHIILVDNGRWRMRDDRDFRVALNCVKCGACSNVCPPFRVVGGHVFGYVYTGPIGLVVTGHHHGLENIAEAQSLCLGCNACETVCPVGIPLPQLIGEVRIQAGRLKKSGRVKRALVKAIASPKRLEAGMRAVAKLQWPVTWGSAFTKSLPLPGLRSKWRRMPAVASPPLRDRRPEAERPQVQQILGSGAAGVRVALFPGCMVDWLYPQMGIAAAKVLAACGAQIEYPEAPSCCGLPALNSGDPEAARRMARQTIAAFEAVEADYIVSPSASCAITMAQDYLRLLRDEPEWLERARALAARTLAFTAFMERIARLPRGSLVQPGRRQSVTYHDACQTKNVLGITVEQRRLITDIMGHELIEMVDAGFCCGFGGTFSFDHPAVSARLLDRKLRNAAATDASILVTDNPGCIMQLRGGLKAAGSDVQVLHLAELLALSLPV